MTQASARRRGLAAAAAVALAAVAAIALAFTLRDGGLSAPAGEAAAAPASGDGHAHHDPAPPADRAHHDPAPPADRAHHDPAPTTTPPEQQPAEPSPADALVAATAASIGRWADPRAAEADGYRSIGDALSGYEHFVHWQWAEDDTVLDATRPESLVYEVGADGGRTLVSAMYLLPPGATMDDVPDLGDDRARWHDHDNLCWHPDRTLAGILVNGACMPGGELVVSPPMLHVWIVDHPCGPFAGLQGHGGGCAPHDH